MNSVRARKAIDLFRNIVQLPELERAARLEAECGSDIELRSEVLSLLVSDSAGWTGLDRHGIRIDVNTLLNDAEQPLLKGFVAASRFTVIERLNEGGMGIVYRAVQDNPRREVALKVMRSGSRDLLRRFEREIDILARLRHPCIAQIFDAGSLQASTGDRPYLAMELVRGEPIIAYAQNHRLDLPARLELLAKVCDAVQYAHQSGVIHRDLKPDNILVEDSERGAHPRVLDFGVGMLTGQAAATLATEPGAIVGTIAYMAPEQVSGQTGTQSDVYALGVILHELICGELPIDVRNDTLGEAVRRIHDESPFPISRRDARYRGDLETIVSKALEKEPSRRYASADALATDIRRFLGDDPITARRPSYYEQVRRLARRNRAVAAGAAVVLVAVPVMAVLYLDARRERNQKIQAIANYQSVNKILTTLIEAPDSYQLGKDVRVRDAVQVFASAFDGRDVSPSVASEVYPIVGDALAKYGSPAHALEYLTRAAQFVKDNPYSVMKIEMSSTIPLTHLNRFQEAETIFEQCLSRSRLPAEQMELLLVALTDVANALAAPPRPESARVERLLNRALASDVEADCVDSGILAKAHHAVAQCRFARRDYTSALESTRSAVEGLKRRRPRSPEYFAAAGDELFLRAVLGEPETAIAEFGELIAHARLRFGPDHVVVGQLLVQSGEVEANYLHRNDAAAELLRESHGILRHSLGAEAFLTAQAGQSLARVIGGDLTNPEALALVQEALPVYLRELGPGNAQTVDLWNAYLGMLLTQRESLADATLKARIALSQARAELGTMHPQALEAVKILRMFLFNGEKTQELVDLCREEVELRRHNQGDMEFVYSSHALAFTLIERNDPVSAVTVCESARSWLRNRSIANWQPWTTVLRPYAHALWKLGRFEEAEATLLDVRGRLDSAEPHPDRDPFRTQVAGDFVGLYEQWCLVEPTSECDEKLADARGRLQRLQPSTQPPSP